MSAMTWRCGDCGHSYPMAVSHCTRPFDDYLSLRGGSIESAISRAVEARVFTIVASAEDSLRSESQWSIGPRYTSVWPSDWSLRTKAMAS